MGFNTMKGFRTKNYVVYDGYSRPFNVARNPNPRHGWQESGIGGLYKSVANWLVRENIKTIVGPVCSGAVMAYAIATHSGGKLIHGFTKKANGKYKPEVHYSELNISGDYVVVDDIIATGAEIIYTMEMCYERTDCLPKAILCCENYCSPNLRKSKLFSEVPVLIMGFNRRK